MRTGVALALILICPSVALSDDSVLHFQFMLEQCEADSPLCTGYVAAVLAMMDINSDLNRYDFTSICHYDSISFKAAIKSVTNYGEQHPETWSREIVFPVMAALRQTWPCPLK